MFPVAQLLNMFAWHQYYPRADKFIALFTRTILHITAPTLFNNRIVRVSVFFPFPIRSAAHLTFRRRLNKIRSKFRAIFRVPTKKLRMRQAVVGTPRHLHIEGRVVPQTVSVKGTSSPREHTSTHAINNSETSPRDHSAEFQICLASVGVSAGSTAHAAIKAGAKVSAL